ncbi:MAG: murein biosynthesis integral membrane protein MurJ [Acidimicrobiales bacterium]
MTVTGVDGSAPPLARSMAAMTALTALSRFTGFILFVVVAAVVGLGALGNTYQSANTIPNVLYELVIAGVVQAVLIPSLVAHLDRDDQLGAEHVAGAVLGLATIALAVVAVAGAVAAPWLARALFADGENPAVRAAQARTGTVFLWFFLPQVVCYAAGLVATSVLNARHRFALPAVAPLANNVVVLVALAGFWRLRDGSRSVRLSAAETVVLAGGTTLGVVAFCGLPVMAARRSGFRLRPNLDHRNPEVRSLARQGAWAAVFLAATQLLLVVVLVLGNRVQGGLIAYQLGFQFFLLPHALFALPVLTTLFPTLSRLARSGDHAGFGATVGRGVETIAYLVVPMAVLLGALGGVVSRTVLFGQAGPAGTARVAGALAGFAPGLVGYGLFLFASRVSYARGDTRTPALVNLVAVVAGGVVMVVASAVVPDRHRVAALAASHSLTYLAGSVVLLRRVVRALPRADRPALAAAVARPVALGLALATVLVVAVRWVHPVGRAAGTATLAVLGAATLAAYVGLATATGGPRPSTFVTALRAGNP